MIEQSTLKGMSKAELIILINRKHAELNDAIAQREAWKENPDLPREPLVEGAISWAKQHGYSFANHAAKEYAHARGLLWKCDQAAYELWAFFTPEEIAERDHIMRQRRAAASAAKQ